MSGGEGRVIFLYVESALDIASIYLARHGQSRSITDKGFLEGNEMLKFIPNPEKRKGEKGGGGAS